MGAGRAPRGRAVLALDRELEVDGLGHPEHDLFQGELDRVLGVVPAFGSPGAAATTERLARKEDRKSTRLNSSHVSESRMPSSA